MALNLNMGGGDNEYVDAASRAAGKGGGIGKLFSGILDALGVHTQVAKAPKEQDLAEGLTPQGKEKKQQAKLADANSKSEDPVTIPAIAEAETALGVQPLQMAPIQVTDQPITPWGQRYLEGLKPLTQIDPDLGILRK